MKKQLTIIILILSFLFIGTTVAILYGRGYRFFVDKGKPAEFSQTGMLVATSYPDGAQVFINGHLTTATNNTINLPPGEYDVKIAQDGYFSWQKKIKIQKEVVSKADALLFPIAPALNSITANGVENPVVDPSFTKIAYTVASQSARKNGIYVLDMNTRPVLTLQSSSTQLVDDTIDIFSKATVSWSPDGKEILASPFNISKDITTYLIKTNSFNDQPRDVTATLESVKESWTKEKQEKDIARLAVLKTSLRTLITKNFNVISWSPDETKILYQASTSATLPVIIKPRLLGIEATSEQRQIEKESFYVYDIKEDKNYKLNLDGLTFDTENLESHSSLKWFPDSKHFIYVHDKKIDVLEFDGTNQTTVYAGPFIDNYVFPWSNGSKILILTNLGNPSTTPNLYTIELK